MVASLLRIALRAVGVLWVLLRLVSGGCGVTWFGWCWLSVAVVSGCVVVFLLGLHDWWWFIRLMCVMCLSCV